MFFRAAQSWRKISYKERGLGHFVSLRLLYDVSDSENPNVQVFHILFDTKMSKK